MNDGATIGTGGLTPTQLKTLEALRRSGEPLVFDSDLVADIRTEMRVALDEFTERLQPNQDVYISKYKLTSVLECEENHLIPDDFEWKPSTAKGQVAHRAIQLTLSWRGEPNPTRNAASVRGSRASLLQTRPIYGASRWSVSRSSWSASRRWTSGRIR